MTRTTFASVGAALGTALTLAACGDGQTGSDYRGEPLMSLRGVVTSSESALSESLVPTLSFLTLDEFSTNEEVSTYFVKSEVEGTFPSAFTMRIYEPPPDEVLRPLFDGEPGFAGGDIIAMSPDHPGWLRQRVFYDDIEENGVVIGNEQRNELCDDTGECVSGHYSDCPQGVEYDPSAQWPCGGSYPDGLSWEIYGYSSQYAVIYFDGEVATGSVLSKLYGGGESIASGYHALRMVDLAMLPPQEQQARTECVTNARIQAIDVANEIYGTMAVFPNISELADLDKQLELNRQTMIAEADLGCQPLVELIADPDSDPIELPFTDQPQRHTF